MWHKLIIIFLLFVCTNAFGAYTGTMPKDIGTSTPTGDENPNVIDDVFREDRTIQYNLYRIKSVSTDTTLLANDSWVIASSTSGILLTMPSASSVANGSATKPFWIKNISTGTVTLNITVDGVGSPTVAGSQTMNLFTDGTTWFEIRAGIAATATSASNALLLNKQNGAFYTSSSNQDAGTLPLARLPATLTGKDADTIDGINGSSIVQGTRTITATTPITIGGGASADLSADRTIAMATATTSVDGFLRGTDFTTFNNKQAALNGLYLSKWIVGAVDGTGTVEFIAGAGTSIVAVDNNGSGSITVTAVGTATAGGWVDTGTQTQSIQGQPIEARGTFTLSSVYGLSGLLDRDVPNTITLDNVTQITTRNLSDMQGKIVNSQMPSTNPYGTITIASTTATTTSSTIMPINTVPTITDGVEVLTTNYGASTSTARLDIEVVLQVATTDMSKHIIAGLYINSGTSAVTSKGMVTGSAVVGSGELILHYNYLPGTTSTWAYAIRLGPGTNTGGAPTTALNSYAYGASVLPLFGNGGCTSTARIIEYIP